MSREEVNLTDSAGRVNMSSFKLVFDTSDAANEYTNWLQTSPNDALGTVLRRAIGSYDENGNFKQTLLPSTATPKGKFNDPFGWAIKKVVVKDLRAT